MTKKGVIYLPDFKICSECKQKKSQTEFYLRTQLEGDGLSSRCKECEIKKGCDNHRRRNFNLTTLEYELMLKTQSNFCAICGQSETEKHQSGKIKELSVDHQKKPFKVRGLLCNKCNRGIGSFNHNPELLEAAAKYLRKS